MPSVVAWQTAPGFALERGRPCENPGMTATLHKMQFTSRRTPARSVLFTILIVGGMLAADLFTAAASVEASFPGRWDLTITDVATKKQMPSWLELKHDHNLWEARFVGRWGNARPLPVVAVTDKQIHFVSPKEAEG